MAVLLGFAAAILARLLLPTIREAGQPGSVVVALFGDLREAFATTGLSTGITGTLPVSAQYVLVG